MTEREFDRDSPVDHREPGLNRHEWTTEWEALQPLVQDSPAEALPELDDLVERILVARGYAIDDAVARQGEEREIVSSFLAAREITRLYESGADISPGDIPPAIDGYRTVYDELVGPGSGP